MCKRRRIANPSIWLCVVRRDDAVIVETACGDAAISRACEAGARGVQR